MFSEADYEALSGLLEGLQGRFILSINDTPLMRSIFGGFAIEEVELSYRISGGSDGGAGADYCRPTKGERGVSIYDRTGWPSPGSNPLVLMFQRGDPWYRSTELNIALDPRRKGKRSVISNWPTLAEQLDESDTMVESRHYQQNTTERQGRTGGLERYFSRRALVLIALRAHTPTAATFRFWLATRAAESSFEAG